MVIRLVVESANKKIEDCGFEVYNKQENSMVSCGEKSIAKTSKCSLCLRHLEHFLSGSMNRHKMFDEKGVEIFSTNEFLDKARRVANEND